MRYGDILIKQDVKKGGIFEDSNCGHKIQGFVGNLENHKKKKNKIQI